MPPAPKPMYSYRVGKGLRVKVYDTDGKSPFRSPVRKLFYWPIGILRKRGKVPTASDEIILRRKPNSSHEGFILTNDSNRHHELLHVMQARLHDLTKIPIHENSQLAQIEEFWFEDLFPHGYGVNKDNFRKQKKKLEKKMKLPFENTHSAINSPNIGYQAGFAKCLASDMVLHFDSRKSVFDAVTLLYGSKEMRPHLKALNNMPLHGFFSPINPIPQKARRHLEEIVRFLENGKYVAKSTKPNRFTTLISTLFNWKRK